MSSPTTDSSVQAPLTPLRFLERSSEVFPEKGRDLRRRPPPDLSRDGAARHASRARTARADEQELIEHCRTRIARYKVPNAVELVAELPKTSTGKVQKHTLRAGEWAGEQSRIKG